MKLAAAEREAARLMAKAGVDSPGLCARLLMAHVLGVDKLECVLRADRELAAAEERAYAALAQRRAAGEPMAYILGQREFYKHQFIVTRHTLVPRPETELVVELALRFMGNGPVRFADLGCGTGCIGLSLLAARPEWSGLLLEKSREAIKVARANASKIAPAALILAGDIFNAPFARSSLDLALANPPYIGLSEKDSVMPETLAHEPHMALFSGNDGLCHLEAVVDAAKMALRGNGRLIMEHGWGQAGAVAAMLRSAGFTHIENYRDLAGLPRCSTAIKKSGR